MRLVVDTNVLFSFFWKRSVTRELLLKPGLELCAPEYALEEINKHEKEILKKTGLSAKEFSGLRHDLAVAVIFVSLEEYAGDLKTALKTSPDPDDADFFALALKLNAPLWSNDALLKGQSRVRVVTTRDLLENPDFASVLFSDG